MRMHKPKLQTYQRTAKTSADVRPRAGQPVYSTERWKQLSKQLRRNGRCVDCGASQRERRLVLDHVKELADGGSAFDLANLVCRCWRCHGIKTKEAAKQRELAAATAAAEAAAAWKQKQ